MGHRRLLSGIDRLFTFLRITPTLDYVAKYANVSLSGAEVASERESKFDSLKEHKIVSLCVTFCSASLENSVTKETRFFLSGAREGSTGIGFL